jgi:hypothetical protein
VPRLPQVYTSGVAEHLLQTLGLGALFVSSSYSGTTLQVLVDAYSRGAHKRRPGEEVAPDPLFLNGPARLTVRVDPTSGRPVSGRADLASAP